MKKEVPKKKTSAKRKTPAKRRRAPRPATARGPLLLTAGGTQPPGPLPIVQAKVVKQRAPRWLGWAISLVAIGGVWLAGNSFFTRVNLANGTTLAARVSDITLEQDVQITAASYRLQLQYPDGKMQAFSLGELGIQVDPAATVRAVRAQQHSPGQWLAWWRPVPAQLVTTVDSTKLHAFVVQHASIVTAAPSNASLSIENGSAKLTDATPGKGYGLEQAADTLLTTAQELQPAPLRLQLHDVAPAVTAAALATTKARLEAVLHQHISIDVGDDHLIPTPSDVAAWLILSPADSAPKNTSLTVDAAKIHDYLDAAAKDHIHPAHSQILDSNGNTLVPGQRGVRAIETGDAAQTLADNLLSGQDVTVHLPAQLTDFKTVTAPTEGKWIEVDTTGKRMYAYDHNQLTRSFLVSSGAPATPTVTGRYAIYAKYARQDMFGQNADGSNYFQPSVPWVNYFYGGYAIHGNYWRPAGWFGNINSSHGCVGVTVSDGAWIYSWAPVGTPVIIHT